MVNYYLDAIKKYAVFSGRASVPEFWQFVLLNVLVNAALYILEKHILGIQTRYFSALYNMFVFLPSLAVTVRRLHDTGRSGWWILISGIPVLGAIILIVFLMSEGVVEARP
ncbi:MAG TPA: DUF805 domain-containing protein [Elusimicrobia bacterium]|nr:DUF805 domain-containing protein [Elusimicrobiota bacterium]